MAQMGYIEAVNLLAKYKINVIPGKVVKTVESAVASAEYPVVLKALSPKIIHKSDSGFVVLNIQNGDQLTANFLALTRKAEEMKIKLDGILMQKMADKGLELIIGIKNDPQFGKVVLFGLGGIFVELIKDFSIRLCPVSLAEAKQMMDELKAGKILSGIRGQKGIDKEKIAELIVNISKLAVERKEIVELDLNPVIAYEKGYTIVDPRIIVNGGTKP